MARDKTRAFNAGKIHGLAQSFQYTGGLSTRKVWNVESRIGRCFFGILGPTGWVKTGLSKPVFWTGSQGHTALNEV